MDPTQAPLKVTVISGTGDGTPIQTGTVGQTPDHQPNLVAVVVTPIAAITIRFINAYLSSLVGLVTGAGITGVIQASDFVHLVAKCAGLALAGPAVGLIKDLITVLTGLEKRYPLATGNV